MLVRMILLGAVLATVGLGQPSGGYPPGKWREPCCSVRTLLPSVGVHDTGLLTVTIDDIGGQEGWRLTYSWPDTTPVDHLFWNWLAVGLGPQSVADAWDFDWYTTTGGSLVILEPGPFADEEGLAEFADTSGRVRVKQHSYAWGAEPDEDYIIVDYTIVNTSGVQQDSLYVSHRADFDVMGDHAGAMADKSGFDSSRALGYMWDTTSTTHAGVALLDTRFCGYHTGWHVVDDADKYDVMSTAGADSTTPSWDDWCFWLSAGPYQVPVGDSIDVIFAFLMGESLEDLQANADRALTRWMRLSVAEVRPARLEPMVAATICRSTLVLSQASSPRPQAASLLDISGRNVRALHPGANDVSRLAAGVYFVREEPQASSSKPQAVRKVVISR